MPTPKFKPYKFIECNARRMLPIGEVRVSPYGVCIPQWLREKFNARGETKLKVSIDVDNKAILLRGCKETGRRMVIGQTVGNNKMFANFKVKLPIICPCVWNKKYQGYIINIAEGKDIEKGKQYAK